MYNFNVDWPIVLDACYFNVNAVCSLPFPLPQNSTTKTTQLTSLSPRDSQHAQPTPPAST